MAALGIKQRWDCCEANGCDDGNSQCCTDLKSMCPGMDVGDFVAVLSYTIQLFTPLNFLGSVYNAIVMAAGGETLSMEAMDNATATQWQRRRRWNVRR